MSPLSDRASRINGDAKRPSQYEEAKATVETNTGFYLFRGPRAWHADIVDAGTWENHSGDERMQNCDIKKDNFKKSENSTVVVRLTCSSAEVG